VFVNDASRIVIDDYSVMLYIVASLTGVIYDCNKFIVQATGCLQFHSGFQDFFAQSSFFQRTWIFLLGIFFVLPCIESYQKVDLRTITLDVPPQEVKNRTTGKSNKKTNNIFSI
jgi:hypothetical protein